jgi:hypothetical protein
MTLRAPSTVPQRFETKHVQMQRGGVREHVVQNEEVAKQPGLVPRCRGHRARSCHEHLLASPDRRRTPPPNGSGRGAHQGQPGTKPPVRDGKSTCRGHLLRRKAGSNHEIRASRTGARRGRAAHARRQAGADCRGWVRRRLLPRRPAACVLHRRSLCEKHWSRNSTCTSSCAPAGLADKTSRPAKGGCTHGSHGRSHSPETCGIASSPQMRMCPR